MTWALLMAPTKTGRVSLRPRALRRRQREPTARMLEPLGTWVPLRTRLVEMLRVDSRVRVMGSRRVKVVQTALLIYNF